VPPAKRRTTRKAAPARKTAARKTTAKKAPARKTAARKTTARKTAAKKAPAKRKAAAKKTTAKRAPAKRDLAGELMRWMRERPRTIAVAALVVMVDLLALLLLPLFWRGA